MYTDIDDTIVAVSSAPGSAQRGIVRLSGPAAVVIGSELFQCNGRGSLEEAESWTALRGWIVFDDLRRVPATVYVFRAPRSYTRQDIIELHTIGSPPLLDMIVERCVQAGARNALPGEFTARAFLSGAMTLTEAEAVAATIQARSDEQLRGARRTMRGALTDNIHEWRSELADLLSLVEADIDFAEEPIDFISPAALRARVDHLAGVLDEVITRAESHERFDVLPYVLLLGPPNAGKSTLLNCLTGIDRAIASAVSGTTRDVLSATVRLGRIEAVLLDAAGVDDNPDRVVSQGRASAVAAAGEVSLVCLVVDASLPVQPDDVARLASLAGTRVVVAGNKVDLLDGPAREKKHADLVACQTGPVCMVSSATGEGLDALRSLLAAMLGGEHLASDDVATLITARHRQALRSAADALKRCSALAAGLANILDTAELDAVELRGALAAFDEIDGQITTDDLLGRVFASFCIGK